MFVPLNSIRTWLQIHALHWNTLLFSSLLCLITEVYSYRVALLYTLSLVPRLLSGGREKCGLGERLMHSWQTSWNLYTLVPLQVKADKGFCSAGLSSYSDRSHDLVLLAASARNVDVIVPPKIPPPEEIYGVASSASGPSRRYRRACGRKILVWGRNWVAWTQDS